MSPAPSPPSETTVWQERAAFVAQGESKLVVNTGGEIAVQIADASGYPGGYQISDQWGDTHAWGSVGFGNSGLMTFLPAIGQDGYEFDITWNPLPIAAIDDYPDPSYGVILYTQETIYTSAASCGQGSNAPV